MKSTATPHEKSVPAHESTVRLRPAGTTAGYASLIAPLQAISQSRVARWPHPDTLRIDLALHRHLHGLPHFIPPERADHPPALRILRHTARIITGASIGSLLDEILAPFQQLLDDITGSPQPTQQHPCRNP